jgi:hypothetical protein
VEQEGLVNPRWRQKVVWRLSNGDVVEILYGYGPAFPIELGSYALADEIRINGVSVKK